ncbi:MAG: fungal specific transcription factor domain-containing protein [Cytophagaceae bacterium]|nr:MAG: fungal specific transcription factor domain-containing protein [Cytophagaceae bacterium]
MFFQLLYIHLFRPFLKYNPNNSPLPAHVSPRKLCTQAAAMISKLLRLYKRSHGLRQICNICVYIAHSACTIHLLNLPEKNAKRDIIHGVKHLEEIAEGWLCARRTLGILSVLAKRWKVELPEEAGQVLQRTDSKFGPWNEVSTPKPSYSEPVKLEDHHPSPADQASPSLQPYSMNIATVTTPQYVNRVSHNNNNSVSIDPYARSHDSLPPSDPNALAYTHAQHHSTPQSASYTPVTPASTQARQSIDGQSTAGNSPSQLFGGVDQLIREGQDWIFRDQTQLANGFENWHPGNIDDIASWFASTQSPTNGYPAPGVAAPMNGGPVGGAPTNGFPANLQANGDVPVNGSNGLNGIADLQGFTYDESTWYDSYQ